MALKSSRSTLELPTVIESQQYGAAATCCALAPPISIDKTTLSFLVLFMVVYS
jgi:hypothetical protein